MPADRRRTADVQTVQASRCPHCGSTRRTKYHAYPRQKIAGTDAHGRPYTAILRGYCRCLDCGKGRIDRRHEYAPTRPTAAEQVADTADQA